jgi:hypothetical protein
MFRKSNTTVGNVNAMDTSLCIRKADIEIDPINWKWTISVRKSKTNQFSERVHKVAIQGIQHHPLDPVAAVLQHFQINGLQVGDFAFSFFEGGGSSSRCGMRAW